MTQEATDSDPAGVTAAATERAARELFPAGVAPVQQEQAGHRRWADGAGADRAGGLCRLFLAHRPARAGHGGQLYAAAAHPLYRRRGQLSPAPLYLSAGGRAGPHHLCAPLGRGHQPALRAQVVPQELGVEDTGPDPHALPPVWREGGGTVYLLGTERFGRDLWGRSCLAGRISLSLSMFAVFISVAVGSIVGVTSGYYGGWIDNVIQRFIEFVQSFPTLPLWMALAALVPPTWSSIQGLCHHVLHLCPAGLDAVGPRGAGQGHGLSRDRLYPGRQGDGGVRQTHHFQAPVPQLPEPHHRRDDAA